MTGWFSLREDGWFGSITISYFTFGRLPNQENLKSSLGAIAEFRPSKWQFSSSAPFWGVVGMPRFAVVKSSLWPNDSQNKMTFCPSSVSLEKCRWKWFLLLPSDFSHRSDSGTRVHPECSVGRLIAIPPWNNDGHGPGIGSSWWIKAHLPKVE